MTIKVAAIPLCRAHLNNDILLKSVDISPKKEVDEYRSFYAVSLLDVFEVYG